MWISDILHFKSPILLNDKFQNLVYEFKKINYDFACKDI